MEKTLVLSIVCSKCKTKDEKLFKGEESIDILWILGLFKNIYSYFKNMVEENISQGFRLKNISETGIFFFVCLNCRKNTESKNPKVVKTKNRKIILLSKCAFFDNKKSKFIKEQEANGLLSSLGIKAPLNETPLGGPLLF